MRIRESTYVRVSSRIRIEIVVVEDEVSPSRRLSFVFLKSALISFFVVRPKFFPLSLSLAAIKLIAFINYNTGET